MLHKYGMDNGIVEDCGLELEAVRQAATELEQHIIPPPAPRRESVVNIDTTQQNEPADPDVVVGDEMPPGLSEVQPLMDKWDISGCTLITDGTQERKSRAVLNFVADGESGVVVIKVVDVSDGKKNVRALAKLWEEVIREIGAHRVNEICTYNASMIKRAAKLLSMRTDKVIAKIPWIPCAAHTLSLLLKDISNIPWIKTVWKKGKNLVKFIKNHQSMLGLLSRCSMGDTKVLVMPTKVDTVLSIMKPIFDLPRMMDSDGVTPSQLWGFDDLLNKRMQTMAGVTSEHHHEIMKLVVDRCQMVAEQGLPARAQHIEVLLDTVGGKSWGDLDSHEEVWNNLWTFHCQPQKEKMKDEDLWNRFAVADTSLERKIASQWWGLYGSKHIELQKIAMRVTTMWSTAMPCEKNWLSLDLVHSKRRNNLSSESVAKLVYIHLNMQLLRVPRSTTDGFIDLWATFFDGPEAPPVANDAAKDRRKDLRWRTMQPRIAHEVGRGNGRPLLLKTRRTSDMMMMMMTPTRILKFVHARAAADSDTDGGRVDLLDVPKATCHLDSGDDLIVEDSEARDRRVRTEAQSMADRDRVMVQKRMAEENSRRLAIPAHMRTVKGHVQQQAEQRPQQLVQQPVEQNPQRVVRQQQEQRPQQKQHEVDLGRQQVEQQLQQDMEQEQQNMKQQQQQHNEEQQQLQNEEQHQQPSQQLGQEQHTGQQQRQTDQQQHNVEQQQQQQTDQQQQDVEQQQQQQAEHYQQQQQQPRTTATAAAVTTTTDTALETVAGSNFYCPPPMPRLDEAMVHDNVDISRAGRKRKVPVEPLVAKHGRGRPRKGERKSAAAVPVLPPMATEAGRPKRKQRKQVVVEDDPTGAEDSSDGQWESDCDWL
ncbi:hypothetical protein CBR_g21970 [Chara braunii]|uniref:DUF659 domain-containing protein n=1 Tax=Chara braunii TaxID=69332 RepID=A0A388L1X3_CHABU|nr:hypothetical protein CBR_g21970 [Chara braunii]|eukprot:GBG76222.1 hypothetical protein CBR_g21970 [Chara braunii]